MKLKNKALASVHALLVFGYAALWLYFAHWYESPARTVLVVLIAVHLVAAYGAVQGAVWGRRTSKVIGIVLLFGVPIGTVLGMLILSRLGSNWANSVPVTTNDQFSDRGRDG